MSASSPESAEFAARHRIGVGFAVTTVPLARDSALLYQQVAHEMGWQPTPDDVLYRVPIYVARTDDAAIDDLHDSLPPGRLELWTPAIDEAVTRAGFHGRDVERQRARHHAGVVGSDIQQRVARGQMLVGSPETVLGQIRSIGAELGAGIFDLIFLGPNRDKTRQAIELFGTEVLPRMRQLEPVLQPA
jgi:alkanesulfonate monooxygenase SsuD/methylene tetrahydromethanopterin reductase-like flavin-dependent oxidoreductase (luciferase family)